MNKLSVLVLIGAVAMIGCGGGDTPTSPSAATSSVSSIAVTVNSPVKIAGTAQATGTASLSNGQIQSITSGWLSDQTGVATVTAAGLVTGVGNGRATIYVVSGGKQGQQVIRVVPDYQGSWSGGIRVTSCSQTGAFAAINFCSDSPVNTVYSFGLSISQSGESLSGRLTEDPFVFPGFTTSIGSDGSTTFVSTYSEAGGTIESTVRINSTGPGNLTGTIDEVWRVTGASGEGRISQNIVGVSRSSTTQAGGSGASLKSKALGSLLRQP
jgi:hypothetical protein